MPPVFGPASFSKALLWSCTTGKCTKEFPSVSVCRLNSSPSNFSSIITDGCVSSTSLQYANASSLLLMCSPKTLTPFPPVNPSGFTTYFPSFVRNARISMRLFLSNTLNSGDASILYYCSSSLVKLLLVSSCRNSFVGPTHFTRAFTSSLCMAAYNCESGA